MFSVREAANIVNCARCGEHGCTTTARMEDNVMTRNYTSNLVSVCAVCYLFQTSAYGDEPVEKLDEDVRRAELKATPDDELLARMRSADAEATTNWTSRATRTFSDETDYKENFGNAYSNDGGHATPMTVRHNAAILLDSGCKASPGAGFAQRSAQAAVDHRAVDTDQSSSIIRPQ